MTQTATAGGGAPPSTDPVVLLPGFLSDARLWGAQIAAMSFDRHLCLPSLGPGSSVDEMARHALGGCPPRFALVGHSLGAAVAMEIFRQAPERVTRLALLSMGCMTEMPATAADRDMRIARVKAGRLADVLPEEFPDSAFAPGEMQAEVAGFLRDMAADLGPEVYLRHARALQRRPDQQRSLRGARMPVLVIAGRHDRIVLARRQQFVAELVQRGTYVETEAGHVPQVETPDTVTRALTDWLDRAPEIAASR